MTASSTANFAVCCTCSPSKTIPISSRWRWFPPNVCLCPSSGPPCHSTCTPSISLNHAVGPFARCGMTPSPCSSHPRNQICSRSISLRISHLPPVSLHDNPPTSLSVERARLMHWAYLPIRFIHLPQLSNLASSQTRGIYFDILTPTEPSQNLLNVLLVSEPSAFFDFYNLRFSNFEIRHLRKKVDPRRWNPKPLNLTQDLDLFSEARRRCQDEAVLVFALVCVWLWP